MVMETKEGGGGGGRGANLPVYRIFRRGIHVIFIHRFH